MAIGVRITSNNLSGQTASITFQSMTGGTPIDLGIQTIPFNYYNELPYGNFTISSTTYDYVYTLTVSQPYGENQDYMYLGNVSGQTTYSLGFLNFNDFSAEIIDLGVDTTYWNENNWYPLSESGSMLDFRNDGNTERLVLFLDVNGNVVDQFSATTFDSLSGILDGRIAYFQDPDGGLFYWFNGETVYQYTFDPNTETLDIQWDWDATCLDNTFVFILRNTGTTTSTSYRVRPNGSVQPIDSWDYNLETRYYGLYYSSKYFYEFSFLNVDDTVSSIKIYNTSGGLVYYPEFLSETYNNWSINWYGNQSFNIILWNDMDDSVDYLILNHDCLNDISSDTTHAKPNYPNRSIQTDTLYFPNDVPVGGIFIHFYNTTGTFFPGGGYEIDYLDIVYKLENQESLQTYVFTNTGDNTKKFYIYGYGNKNYNTYCSTGGTNSSIFSINNDGVKITPTEQNINEITNVDYDDFGEYYVLVNSVGDNSYFYLSLNGNIEDTLTLDTSSGYDFTSRFEVFYVENSSTAYYVNNLVTGFTQTGYYNSTSTPTSYYNKDYYYRPEHFLVFNTANGLARVLSNNKLYNGFSLPLSYNDSSERRIGRDKFIYVYNDNSDNTRINLYDFNGALLNSTLVNITGWDYVYAVKDRYVVVQDTIDGQRLLTMISKDEVKQITIDNQYSSWDIINDYIWWD